MAKLTKKQKAVQIDSEKLHGIDEAITLARTNATSKFDETIEVALNLGVDPRHADQQVRGMVSLPAGTGKTVKVAVFPRGDTADKALEAGADKVGVNTAAVERPELIAEIAGEFGDQCVVVAVDARASGDESWEVYLHGGRTTTGIDVVEWAVRATELGAGEILLTSMDRDGTGLGFEHGLNAAVSAAVDVPVIASGGVGTLEHPAEGIANGDVDAVLAASHFHFGTHTIAEARAALSGAGITVRGMPR